MIIKRNKKYVYICERIVQKWNASSSRFNSRTTVYCYNDFIDALFYLKKSMKSIKDIKKQYTEVNLYAYQDFRIVHKEMPNNALTDYIKALLRQCKSPQSTRYTPWDHAPRLIRAAHDEFKLYGENLSDIEKNILDLNFKIEA